MDFKKIKMIAFDLGYTLALNYREEIYQKYLATKNIEVPMEKIQLAFHLTDKTFMREYPGMLGRPPQVQLPWYLGVVSFHVGEKIDLLEVTDFFINTDKEIYWKLFPWTRKVLEGLLNKGYRLALLSNWDLSCRNLLQDLGIYELFEAVIVSSEVGIEKPDKRIFELLLKETGLNPSEILYVGDNYYDDCVGARKVGIETIILNRFDRLGIEEINDCIVVKTTEDLFSILESTDGKVEKLQNIRN